MFGALSSYFYPTETPVETPVETPTGVPSGRIALIDSYGHPYQDQYQVRAVYSPFGQPIGNVHEHNLVKLWLNPKTSTQRHLALDPALQVGSLKANDVAHPLLFKAFRYYARYVGTPEDTVADFWAYYYERLLSSTLRLILEQALPYESDFTRLEMLVSNVSASPFLIAALLTLHQRDAPKRHWHSARQTLTYAVGVTQACDSVQPDDLA